MQSLKKCRRAEKKVLERQHCQVVFFFFLNLENFSKNFLSLVILYSVIFIKKLVCTTDSFWEQHDTHDNAHTDIQMDIKSILLLPQIFDISYALKCGDP